ncbi:MAG: FAD-dependent oxidoreductase [Bacteroidota bacterium]
MTTPPTIYDYLIVGQGLAGTLMDHFLQSLGQHCLLIDHNHQGASSLVAAGIINPITGRRFAKSWRIDELLPFARQTYRAIEERLGLRCFYDRHIVRALFSIQEENKWLGRSALPTNQAYTTDSADPSDFLQAIQPPTSWMELQGCAQLDMPRLVTAYREQAIAEQGFLNEPFDYDQLEILPEGLRYKTHQARNILFCEGQQAQQNPWFGQLAFETAKGEVFLIKVPGLRSEKLLKHKLMLAPLGEELFWIGSNYEWNAKTDQPTEKGKQWLLKRMDKMLQVPYEIVDHQAAIRPAVKDRRPLLGRHPVQPRLAIFNGLGTKGASLGPFWASAMAQHLVCDTPLDHEVDINRYFNVDKSV